MKFSNGQWLTKEGLAVHAPVQAYRIEADQESLTVLAPCKHIAHRGATLDGPVLTVRFSSPLDNVIRVQITHFTGAHERGPRFAVKDERPPVRIVEDEESARLTSGRLSVSVSKKGPWHVEYADGDRRLTTSGAKGMAYIRDQGAGAFVREQLGLGVGEYVYGLGERFTPFVKNGQSVDIWNEDGGTSTEQSYKNIPFYMSSQGYGVFVNHPERVSFEVGSEVVSKVQFSVMGESLEYYLIAGPNPKDVLTRYAALTGLPTLPPAWSFGLWLTTSFTTNYDEETVNHFVDGMRERKVPLHVFHFDCFWMKEFEWCNFSWDERVFPDPGAMLKRLHDKGLRVCVWINPYIAQSSPLFREAAQNGYLLKRPNGDVWQWDLWQAGMGIVDFTNPDACAWFVGHLKRLTAMGVDSFKTDFGERIPLDVTYFDGSDPHKMHNYYAYLYNKVVFEGLKEARPDGDAVLFARSATVGSQQFPVHWGGDCAATYESMAESLRGGLSLCLGGFGFWSHDIGGFENTATADLYKRWTAFGLLSTHSRLHGNSSYRVPWLFDEEAVDVLRHFTEQKCRLMPYIFSHAVAASQSGIPVMRPMLLEFFADPTCLTLDRQYMLGDSLLVAPVFRDDGTVSYYLPRGTWTHFMTGEIVEGGGWREEHDDYFSLPIFVRENSLIAIGDNATRPDYDYADGVTFHLFALQDGQTASATVFNLAGQSDLRIAATRSGQIIAVMAKGRSDSWRLHVRGIERVKVAGGSAEPSGDGVLIVPAGRTNQLWIEVL